MSKKNIMNAVLVVLSALLIVAKAVCQSDMKSQYENENRDEL